MHVLKSLKRAERSIGRRRYKYSVWHRCACGHLFCASYRLPRLFIFEPMITSRGSRYKRYNAVLRSVTRANNLPHNDETLYGPVSVAAAGGRTQALNLIRTAIEYEERRSGSVTILPPVPTVFTPEDEQFLRDVEHGRIKSKLLIGGGTALSALLAVVAVVSLF